MAARKPAPRVRFVRQYSNWAGNVFRRYQTPDGRITEIRIKEGWGGRYEYTGAQAKAEAIRRLSRRRQ